MATPKKPTAAVKTTKKIAEKPSGKTAPDKKRNSPVAPGIYARATKGFKAVAAGKTLGYFKTLKLAITARADWNKKAVAA